MPIFRDFLHKYVKNPPAQQAAGGRFEKNGHFFFKALKQNCTVASL
jgi:hypothetical protein